MSGDYPKSVNLLDRLHAFNEGTHDELLNPLVFLLKLAAEMRAGREGGGDKVTVGLNQLANQINLSRYSLRFLVGISSLRAILRKSYKHNDQIVTALQFSRLVLNVLYNVAELQSYVKMVAPAMVSYDAAPAARRSCQLWALNILLDLICMMRKNELSSYKLKSDSSKLNLFAKLANLVLAVNWGSTTPFLTSFQVALLGSLSGLVTFFERWRSAGQ